MRDVSEEQNELGRLPSMRCNGDFYIIHHALAHPISSNTTSHAVLIEFSLQRLHRQNHVFDNGMHHVVCHVFISSSLLFIFLSIAIKICTTRADTLTHFWLNLHVQIHFSLEICSFARRRATFACMCPS